MGVCLFSVLEVLQNTLCKCFCSSDCWANQQKRFIWAKESKLFIQIRAAKYSTSIKKKKYSTPKYLFALKNTPQEYQHLGDRGCTLQTSVLLFSYELEAVCSRAIGKDRWEKQPTEGSGANSRDAVLWDAQKCSVDWLLWAFGTCFWVFSSGIWMSLSTHVGDSANPGLDAGPPAVRSKHCAHNS